MLESYKCVSLCFEDEASNSCERDYEIMRLWEYEIVLDFNVF